MKLSVGVSEHNQTHRTTKPYTQYYNVGQQLHHSWVSIRQSLCEHITNICTPMATVAQVTSYAASLATHPQMSGERKAQ